VSPKADPAEGLELLGVQAGDWLVRSNTSSDREVAQAGAGDPAMLYHADPNRLSCDCRGWSRLRLCRHLRLVITALEAEPASRERQLA
jgi:hypothetical protein